MQTSDIAAMLRDSCAEVLESMYFTMVVGETETPAAWQDGDCAALLHFEGEIAGRFGVRLNRSCARTLAANFLGEEEQDVSESEIDEVIGELANIFCGSVLSRLKSDRTFVLSPTADRSHDSLADALRRGDGDR